MLWGDCGYLLFSKFAVRKNIILTSELNMDRAHTAGLRIWSHSRTPYMECNYSYRSRIYDVVAVFIYGFRA